MSLAVNMTTSGPAIRFLQGVTNGLQPNALNQRVGGTAQRLTQRHLRARNTSQPNRLGGARTNFYAQAARATFFTVTNTGVVVSIAKLGMRQRFAGGVIRPHGTSRVTGKAIQFLAIPATAAAHGKRPGEFSDLKFAIVPGKGPALVRTQTVTKNVGRKQKGGGYAQKTVVQAGEVVFWLRRKVTQRADPTVIPDATAFTEAISADLDIWINTLSIRAQSQGASARP